MLRKCADCGFEQVPEEDYQEYSANLKEQAGTVLIVWGLCWYCRQDVSEPLYGLSICLSSTSNLKENENAG